MESLDYPAVATASAAIAYTNGYADGENIPFNDLITIVKKITGKVSVPVTVDIESGYAKTNETLESNIRRLIIAGAVGINIEDFDRTTNTLFPVDIQCKKIKLIKQTATEMGISLFINARTDVYVKGYDWVTPEDKYAETIKRGNAYINAGANCFFPLFMKERSCLERLIKELLCPVNVLYVPGVPDIQILRNIGVTRVSLGPGFLKTALRAMKQTAQKLKNFEGFDEIVNNEVTSDFVSGLVNKA